MSLDGLNEALHVIFRPELRVKSKDLEGEHIESLTDENDTERKQAISIKG